MAGKYYWSQEHLKPAVGAETANFRAKHGQVQEYAITRVAFLLASRPVTVYARVKRNGVWRNEFIVFLDTKLATPQRLAELGESQFKTAPIRARGTPAE
jgi:hypothetical protein